MDQLCHLDAIPDGHSRGFSYKQRAIIAVKQQGTLYLYVNRCPHRGIPLEWQPDQFLDLERQYIQCATHGALFQIDSGRCIQGPCRGQSLEPIDYKIIDRSVWLTPPPEAIVGMDANSRLE